MWTCFICSLWSMATCVCQMFPFAVLMEDFSGGLCSLATSHRTRWAVESSEFGTHCKTSRVYLWIFISGAENTWVSTNNNFSVTTAMLTSIHSRRRSATNSAHNVERLCSSIMVSIHQNHWIAYCSLLSSSDKPHACIHAVHSPAWRFHWTSPTSLSSYPSTNLP